MCFSKLLWWVNLKSFNTIVASNWKWSSSAKEKFVIITDFGRKYSKIS